MPFTIAQEGTSEAPSTGLHDPPVTWALPSQIPLVTGHYEF